MEPDEKALRYLQQEIGSYVGEAKVREMACKVNMRENNIRKPGGASNHFPGFADEQTEIKRRDDMIESLNEELADATSKNEAFLKLITSLSTSQTQTRFKKEKIKTDELHKRIEGKNKEIQELRETVKNLETEIKQKEIELENVNTRIGRLCKEIGLDPASSIKDVEARLHDMQKQPRQLNRQTSLPSMTDYRKEYTMADVLKDEICHLYRMKNEHEHRIKSLSLIVRGMEQNVEYGSLEDIITPDDGVGAVGGMPSSSSPPPMEDDGVFSGATMSPTGDDKTFNMLGLPAQLESVYCLLCRKSVSRMTRHQCLIHYQPEQKGKRLCCQDDRRGGCVQFPHCYVTHTLQNKLVLTDGTSFILHHVN